MRLTSKQRPVASGPTELSPDTLARAKAGDRQAQQVVLKAYDGFIRKMLFRLVGPVADLEDLHQNVLVRIVRTLETFRGDSAISTWIGSMAVHVAQDYRRGRRTRELGVDRFESMTEVEYTGDQDPEHRLDSQRLVTKYYAALDQLSPAQRSVIVLRALGHSIDEIAEMTKSARSTTRLRLYYGRKAFARALGKAAEER